MKALMVVVAGLHLRSVMKTTRCLPCAIVLATGLGQLSW
jgi:hypothetical protein